MKYYNVKTRQHADVLPVPTVPFAVKAGVVQGTANAASIAEWQRAQGWRTVKLCQTAGEGWRVDEWMHTDDDGVNCNLIIAHAVDVAKEQADRQAAETKSEQGRAEAQAVEDARQADAKAAMYAEVAEVVMKVLNARPEFEAKPITKEQVAQAAVEVVSAAISIKPIEEKPL